MGRVSFRMANIVSGLTTLTADLTNLAHMRTVNLTSTAYQITISLATIILCS